MSFNIINTLVLVWFVDFIAKVVTRLVPDNEDEDEVFKLKYISSHIVKTPSLSLQEAKLEVEQFGDILKGLCKAGKKLIQNKDPKKANFYSARITELEDVTDRFDADVSEFIIKITSEELSQTSSSEIRDLLSICSAFEEIGDEYIRLTKSYDKLAAKKIELTEKQEDELKDLYALLEEAILITANNLKQDFKTITDEEAVGIEDKINAKVVKLHKQNLKAIEAKEYGVKSAVIYKDLVTTIEVIADQLLSISQSAIGKYSKEDLV